MKTAEEILQEFELIDNTLWVESPKDEVIEAMESYADQWRRWIPLSERKPTKEDSDRNGEVLYHWTGVNIDILDVDSVNELIGGHWLPIPKLEDGK